MGAIYCTLYQHGYLHKVTSNKLCTPDFIALAGSPIKGLPLSWIGSLQSIVNVIPYGPVAITTPLLKITSFIFTLN